MPSFDKTNPDIAPTHSIDSAHQGLEVAGDDTEELARAIELAFDYRGDVTIVRRSDPQPIEGYIFDRRVSDSHDRAFIRLIPKNDDAQVIVSYSDISSLSFTGRDTAAGKSFETWMKKYVRNKLAGREASIHSESIDES